VRSRLGTTLPAGSPVLVAVGQLVASGLTLVSAPIVARAIGPEGRGLTAAAIACFVIVPVVLGFGMPLELRRRAGTPNGPAAIRTARLIALAATLPAALLGMVLATTLFGEADAATRWSIGIGVAATPATVWIASAISVLVAHRRFIDVLILRVTPPFVYVVVVIVIWAATGRVEVWEVVAGNLAGTLVAALLATWMIRPGATAERVPARQLLRGSAPFAGGSLAEALVAQLPQILAISVLGLRDAGFYSVAATIGMAPLALAHALGAASFSHIALADDEDRTPLVVESTRLAVTAAAASAVLVLAVSPAVPLVFGEAFAEAAPVTAGMAIFTFGAVGSYALAMSLVALGRGWRTTSVNVTMLVIGVGGFLLLGATSGAIAAAIGMGAGALVSLVVALLHMRLPVAAMIPRPGDLLGLVRMLLRRNADA
jgi:O-antigen/teichoic acid export membrane protein